PEPSGFNWGLNFGRSRAAGGIEPRSPGEAAPTQELIATGELAAHAALFFSVHRSRSALPVRGSVTAPAASRTKSRREGTPSRSRPCPEPAESTFSSRPALASISLAWSSAHSVEPTRPYSSASQEA